MTLTLSTLRNLLPCALLFLAACAQLPPDQAHYPVGRGQIILPPGDWQDLGTTEQALPLLPQAEGRIPLQSRAVALRGPQKQLLAVLRVQTNRSALDWAGHISWPAHCPQQQGMLVEDAAEGSRVRMDCLRYKRRADDRQWLTQHQPELAQWMASRQLAISTPFSYMSYHYTTADGAMVAVDALVDQRLLLPRTSGTEAFLHAGRPALFWGRDLAQAVRVSVGMMDGTLTLPPFPYSVPTP